MDEGSEMKRHLAVVAVLSIAFAGAAVASAEPDPDVTVVNPPPVLIPTEIIPPPMTIRRPPPVTVTVTEPAPPPVTVTVTAPPVTTTVTAPPVTTTVTAPPVTTTVTTTVTAPPTTTSTTPPPTTTTTPPPQTCVGPINITTGGTYSGCYRSNDVNTPAVRISTTQPVTLSHARIIAKGNGVWAYDTKGTRLTIVDSVFEQQDPGAVVNHRAVETDQPASFVFEYNTMTDTDGVEIHSLRSLNVSPFRFNNNLAVNVGRYPHPTSGNCCVQMVQLDNVTAPDGQVWWNHSRNVAGQSGIEDNISFYVSGGNEAGHGINVGYNLIDGAYSRDLNVTNFTGGGINLGDGGGGSGQGGGGFNTAHDNVVVSTTNYGISVNGPSNYASNNLLVNDGAEQRSEFGQAIVAWPEVSPSGIHATNSRYNWHRSTTDQTQYPCYVATYCQGTAVGTTEQQARDQWEAGRANANITIGPR